MFTRFSDLPLEVQRMVWQFAAPLFHSRVISLSGYAPSSTGRFTHFFNTRRKINPLLLACFDSQDAALQYPTVHGFELDATGSWLTLDLIDQGVGTECDVEMCSKEYMETLSWNPDTDVIFLKRSKKPLCCDWKEFAQVTFKVDERVKYMAMPADWWLESDTSKADIEAQGLEVVFLFVGTRTVKHLEKWLKQEHIYVDDVKSFLGQIRYTQGETLTPEQEADRLPFRKVWDHDWTAPCFSNTEFIYLRFVWSLEEIFEEIDQREAMKRDAAKSTSFSGNLGYGERFYRDLGYGENTANV